MEAPRIFTTLVHAGSDPSDNTITLALGMDGAEGYARVDLALGMVGPLMAVLAAESLKLVAQLPAGEQTQSASLSVKAAWISQMASGRPALVFELSNGSLLPLEMESGNFAGLAAEMALLAAPKGSAN